MSAVRELFASIGIDFDGKALKEGAKAVDEMKASLQQLAGQSASQAKQMLAGITDAAKPLRRELEQLQGGSKDDDATKGRIKELQAQLLKLKHQGEDAAEVVKKLEAAEKKEADATKERIKEFEEAEKKEAEATKKATEAKEQAAAATLQWRATTLAAQAAVTGVAYAIVAFAQSFAAEAETLRENARDLSATTSELQALRFAAQQSGVSVQAMEGALSSLRGQLLAVTRYGGSSNYTMRLLGVSFRDASGHVRTTGAVFRDVAAGLERVENPMRRYRLAALAFGEENARALRPLLAQRGALTQYADDLERLGGGISPESVEASRGFTREQGRLRVAWDSLRSVVATGLLPVLGAVAGKVAELGGGLVRLTRNSQIVKAALVVFAVAAVAAGIAVAVAWAPVVLPFLGIAVILAELVLVVDDLMVLFRGGRSVIGRTLDALFGVGTATELVRSLRSAWASVTAAVRAAWPVVQRVMRGMVDEASQTFGEWRDDIATFEADFVEAWEHIEGRATEAWETISGRLQPVIDTVQRFLSYLGVEKLGDVSASGVARALASGAAGVQSTGVGALSPQLTALSRLHSLFGAYDRGASSEAPSSEAPATVSVAAPPGAARGRGGRSVTDNSRRVTNHVTVHATGSDPRAVAAEVKRLIDRDTRDALDGLHPIVPQGSE